MDTEKKALVGHVHSLETFGLVDGPGVRTVVFLQGCRMRCRYCHNPETWSMSGGEEWSAKDLFNRVYRYRTYWKNNGGITVSGGEPLLQIDFLLEFFALAKAKGDYIGGGVRVGKTYEDTETEMKMVYDPSHPDADENGYVTYPNVNVITEMTDLIAASRSYEANATAFSASKSMAVKGLEMAQ